MLILGGINDDDRFQTLQNNINEMISIGIDVDKNDESFHYKQLLNKIICNNVQFNQAPEFDLSEERVGTSALDLIVDKHMGDGERLVVAIQHINKFNVFDIFIGVIIIGVKTKNRWFIINRSAIKKKPGKLK